MFRSVKSIVLVSLLACLTFAADSSLMSLKGLSSAKRDLMKMNISFQSKDMTSKFWAIYEKYEDSARKEADAYAAFLKRYSGIGIVIDSKLADEIAAELLRIQDSRQLLLKTAYIEIRTSVSPVAAVRFIQIQNRFAILGDFQTASGYPMELPSGVGSSKGKLEVTIE